MKTLSSLFIVCSHGRRSAHEFTPAESLDLWRDVLKQVGQPNPPPTWCPGGRPATLEDLGGEKVWWCVNHLSAISAEEETCEWLAFQEQVYGTKPTPCDITERILIPLPQMVAGESL